MSDGRSGSSAAPDPSVAAPPLDPAEAKRAGSLLVLDQSAVYDRVSRAYHGQVDLLPIAEARARHAWLDDYWWRALDPGTDRYTAAACLAPTGGLFLHVKAGQRVFDEVGIDYLATRRVDREGATAILTRGFLKAGLPASPGPLERQIHELALLSATGAL